MGERVRNGGRYGFEREGQRDCGWVREIQRYRKIWVGEREGEMGERESEMEENMRWRERDREIADG